MKKVAVVNGELLELKGLLLSAVTLVEVMADDADQQTETPLTTRDLTDLMLMHDTLRAYVKMVNTIRTKVKAVHGKKGAA